MLRFQLTKRKKKKKKGRLWRFGSSCGMIPVLDSTRVGKTGCMATKLVQWGSDEVRTREVKMGGEGQKFTT